jgi:membrane fusion protein, multidrug efflux system
VIKPKVVHSGEPGGSAASSPHSVSSSAPGGSSEPVQFSPARAPAAEQPARPVQASLTATAASAQGGRRSGMRLILLVVIPLIALAGGVNWWLHAGRYVTTDNSYVGAQKVLITPQVTGPITAIHVIEGQKIRTGDPLFDIDPQPYQIALDLAKGRVAAAEVAFANLKSSYVSNEAQIKMGADTVTVRTSDFNRKTDLASRGAGTFVDRDTATAALLQAQQILEFVRQMQETTKVKLGGDLNAPIEKFPDYMQAKAGLEDAERNLRNTKIVAPMDGVATQVPQIELGRVAPAGQPVFAIVADTGLWVDANPKESDMTYVREGLPATVTIDAFPDRVWRGTICSIAPGTGAQFAILPPQNASGNWVKVVQRVPLRFCFDPKEDTRDLRSGMSAYLSIDTGRTRSLGGVLSGLGAWASGLVGPSHAATSAN